MSTVFIGEKKGNGERYSYLIGFENPYLERNIFTYDIRTVGRFLQIGMLTLLCVDGLIALCIAYLFSKRLTRPLSALIDGIKQLAHKNYRVHYETKGIYKDVFYNVNVLTEELRDYSEIIERKSLYLKDVIEDLNHSTRLRNKGLTLNLKSVNIVSLVRNAVIDMLNDAQYGNRNIDFRYSDEVILVEADEILIRRAVANLIYNAVVHNDEHVAVEVSVEKEGDFVRIVVEDHGKGIREEEFERIFDRYYRGTHTGELHKGSGLGMAIAHDIVKAHGGEIQVESELHQGTRIEILLKI
ncbi:sensor histidine kinase [Paenibacillus sp. YSY-4.3]